jgi:signal transduction histidine kinase
MFYKFLHSIVKPKSKDEDSKRRELILNILLVSTIFLLSIAAILRLLSEGLCSSPDSGSLSAWMLFLIDAVFATLYFLSRKGFFALVAYIFVGLYLFLATAMVFLWGVEAQPGLIFFILVIILSGVLVGTKFSFFITILESLILYLIFSLQSNNKIIPDLTWKNPWDWTEVIVVTVILFIMATISWLSNRETEKSLKRARKSEADLKKERDLLEIKVKERTEELKKAQLEKIAQVYRFAEFGRLSSGFFHDLVNPITIVCLNLERINGSRIKEIGEAKNYLSKAVDATRRLESFIMTARKQIRKEEEKKIFSVYDEVQQIIEMLSYKARKANVEVKLKMSEALELFGDSVRFSQAITNLVANAIDAYANISSQTKKVEIKVFYKNNSIFLEIKDFGEGIKKDNLKLIFEPFFSTKQEQGIGIGLSLTKDIIEKDFGGSIEVFSEEGEGAKFVLKFTEHNN